MSHKKQIISKLIDFSKDFSCHAGKRGALTLIQTRTLLFVQSKGQVRASDLAKEFNVTPATITAQIDRLVKDGWLERENCTSDRRAINIILTAKAKKELNAIANDNLERYSWIFDSLTEKDEECLLNILNKICQEKK